VEGEVGASEGLIAVTRPVVCAERSATNDLAMISSAALPFRKILDPAPPSGADRPSLRRPDPSDKGRKGHLSVQSLNRTSGGLKKVPKSGSLV
jgi:hypothetical protein